jgi:hypothetical protein
MSSEDRDLDLLATSKRKWWIAGAVAGGLLIVMILFGLMPRSRPPSTRRDTTVTRSEDPLEVARQALTRSGEADTVRSALTQINTAIGKGIDNPPPGLKPDEAAALKKTCGLNAEDIEEITPHIYSLLDAPHVEYCLLLRDAARSLEVRAAGVKPGPASEGRLDQARLAFAWVMRQVRLYPGQPGEPGRTATPDLVLRRGSGTVFDRALIFLDLLRQTGSLQGSMPDITGALLYCKNADGRKQFWACGVDVGDGRGLYLFDPGLGMPLPGPSGKGIATLGEIAGRKEVLGQLAVPGAPKYDITPDQASTAEVDLYCNLSALSPRMRHLQDEFLPPAVEVRLAVDVAAELARLQRTVAHDGKGFVVGIWKEGVRTWRHFLLPSEGGVGQPQRFALRRLPGFTLPSDMTEVNMPLKDLFGLGVVPWEYLHPVFRNHVEFPYVSGLGGEIRHRFAAPFKQAIATAGARDMLLRGQIRKAIPRLVEEQDGWSGYQKRLETASLAELSEQIRAWKEKAQATYARSTTASTAEAREESAQEIAKLWSDATPVLLLLMAGVAEARSAEIAYQVALCKQEEAERLQTRLDLLEKEKKTDDSDQRKAVTAWREALAAWTGFLRDHRDRPETVAARQLRGRVYAKLGDWKAAVADWKDSSEPMTALERIANLYNANLKPEQYR